MQVDLGGVTNLSDPSGTLVRNFCLLLASCTNVQSLSLIGDVGASGKPLNWGSIQYPIRMTLELLSSCASLEHLQIDWLELPLSSILRQQDSLISLTLHRVSDGGSPTTSALVLHDRSQTGIRISRISTDILSLRILIKRPNPQPTGPPPLDLSFLRTFETVFNIGDLATTTFVRNVIVGAKNLDTLSLVAGIGAGKSKSLHCLNALADLSHC